MKLIELNVFNHLLGILSELAWVFCVFYELRMTWIYLLLAKGAKEVSARKNTKLRNSESIDMTL